LLLRRHEPSEVRVQRLEAVRVQGNDSSRVPIGTDNNDAAGLGRNTVLGVNGSLQLTTDATVEDVVGVEVLAINADVVREVLDLFVEGEEKKNKSAIARNERRRRRER
jgi:hypothetical protein